MRLAFKVFIYPALLLFASILMMLAGDRMAANQYLHAFAPRFYNGAMLAIGLAIAVLLYSLFRLVRAYQGKGDTCYQCGMPVSEKLGRYGPYLKCWGCGARRAIRS